MFSSCSRSGFRSLGLPPCPSSLLHARCDQTSWSLKHHLKHVDESNWERESVQNDMHSFFKKCTPIRTSCFLNCSKRLRCFALVWMPQEWQHCLPHKVFNFFSVQTRASSDGPTFRKIAFVKILFRKICYINNIVRCDYYYFFLSVHWVSGWWGFTFSIPGARENVADVADVSCLTNDGPSVRAAGLSLNMKEIFNLFHKNWCTYINLYNLRYILYMS